MRVVVMIGLSTILFKSLNMWLQQTLSLTQSFFVFDFGGVKSRLWVSWYIFTVIIIVFVAGSVTITLYHACVRLIKHHKLQGTGRPVATALSRSQEDSKAAMIFFIRSAHSLFMHPSLNFFCSLHQSSRDNKYNIYRFMCLSTWWRNLWWRMYAFEDVMHPLLLSSYWRSF